MDGQGVEWFVFLALNLVIVEAKIPFEERLLMGSFPAEYRLYRSRVRRLIPGLKLLAGHSAATPAQGPADKIPGALT